MLSHSCLSQHGGAASCARSQAPSRQRSCRTAALLIEADEVLGECEILIRRINRTNAATSIDADGTRGLKLQAAWATDHLDGDRQNHCAE